MFPKGPKHATLTMKDNEMKIIGREQEIDRLKYIVESKKPEFVCVYGRRRVGKTFLIKQFFNERFSFYATGVPKLNNRRQLSFFKNCLIKYGYQKKGQLNSWLDAFTALIEVLEQPDVYRLYNGKRIVFIDEAPWMDSPRSDFKAAFDFFWNTWGSTKEDLILIVCGSATSWIINNLLTDTGGFYNRVTKQLLIKPFEVREVQKMLIDKGVHFSIRETIETYMIFGGIPYYIDLFNPLLSLAQNVEWLFFSKNSELKYEKDVLLSSLFGKHNIHGLILDTLYTKKSGLTRQEICEYTKLESSRHVTSALIELEQCGFIRSFIDYKHNKKNAIYQLIDPFILFSFNVLGGNISSWENFIESAKYHSWSGQSFEIFCLNHIPQIKETLGITGLSTNEYGFKDHRDNKGAQIDLIIDRKDDVINLCEMKYCFGLYTINKDYEENLLKKVEVFKSIVKTRKGIQITFITPFGIENNMHSHIVARSIAIKDWLD